MRKTHAHTRARARALENKLVIINLVKITKNFDEITSIDHIGNYVKII